MTDEPLAAGDFGPWLDAMEDALAGTSDAEVPCGTCTACCTSSQFVHIGPDEADTLAHVPTALRFPAPGLPPGHVLLGYDERGHCPMLVDGACSIYEHRPRACRTYDCRVFPAAGVVPDDKPLVAARAHRWRFAHPTAGDRARHDAVRAAAAYLTARAGDLPDDLAPRTTTQLAVTAVEAHPAFLGGPEPEPAEVAVEVRRSRPRPPAAPPRRPAATPPPPASRGRARRRSATGRR